MNKILLWVLIGIGVLIIGAAGLMAKAMTVTADKPAIYLYPEQDSQISVKLDINGKLIEDIPEYNSGWNVFVTKEGIIENEYDYLFYEAKLKKLTLPEKGWIVPYDKVDDWFELNLRQLGLNEKEKAQFEEYWLKELPKANYYEIKLLSKEYLDENMALNIEPKPDTMIRLMFTFKPLKKTYEIKSSEINAPLRKGFTVIEWGGILLR